VNSASATEHRKAGASRRMPARGPAHPVSAAPSLGPRIGGLVVVALTLGVGFNVALSAQDASSTFVPVTDEILENPPASEWLMFRRTHDSWGYSPLDQIDRENVHQLGLAWAREVEVGTSEITPLAYDGVLYIPSFEDTIEAVDSTTGDFIWRYTREQPEGLYAQVGFNAKNNRNIAIYDRLILNNSDDNHAFALDAETGELVWETQILDWKVNPATHSSGPIVADGRVVSGRSCRPWGGPESCIMIALDALTGEELWRTRTMPAPGEPGDETWGDVPFEQRRHVGTWMVPSYDPELDLIYFGTAVTSPAPKFMLGGTDLTHLYNNSTLALEPETGEIRWYFQHLNDHWDLDYPFERILVDLPVSPDPEAVRWIREGLEPGETRKVMTGIPGKTGFVYTLDRETGEFLWARPTVPQNVVVDIDETTGRAVENTEIIFTELDQEMLVCPSWTGGKDWEAGSYSPLTRTMYFPLRNMCGRMFVTGDVNSPRAQAFQQQVAIYSLAADHIKAPGEEYLGTVYAISAVTGETEWLFETETWTYSVVATGGGLVFGGDASGAFRAFDHETGEVLWEVNLGAPAMGYPISYAVDGRQYVAISTGPGSLRSTPAGAARARGGNLYVFALPDRR